jgi:hypothetical protein
MQQEQQAMAAKAGSVISQITKQHDLTAAQTLRRAAAAPRLASDFQQETA